MSTRYEHHLKTGSGWTRVILFLNDEEATIEFDSRWMGSSIKRYRLHWSHNKQSDHYGILTLRLIERYVSLDSDETVIEDISRFGYYPDDYDESEIPEPYKDITYEYIRLPKSELWIADEPDLEEMKHFFDLAQWNKTFDIFLWLHFSIAMSYGRLEETDIGIVLEMLDKMKFAVLRTH